MMLDTRDRGYRRLLQKRAEYLRGAMRVRNMQDTPVAVTAFTGSMSEIIRMMKGMEKV